MLTVFILLFSCSAECEQMDSDKDKEKGATNPTDDQSDIEDNSGFAIVVNGHSLVYCLSSELENRFVLIQST